MITAETPTGEQVCKRLGRELEEYFPGRAEYAGQALGRHGERLAKIYDDALEETESFGDALDATIEELGVWADEERATERADEFWYALQDRIHLSEQLGDDAREAFYDTINYEFGDAWTSRMEGEANADEVYYSELDPAIVSAARAAAELCKPGELIGYFTCRSGLEALEVGEDGKLEEAYSRICNFRIVNYFDEEWISR